jgi:hypothetical protein
MMEIEANGKVEEEEEAVRATLDKKATTNNKPKGPMAFTD